MGGFRGVNSPFAAPVARGRVRHETGRMNGVEKAWANELEKMRAVGLIQWYSFETVKIRLADKTFYEPDFLVVAKDGTLECHEVKARWADGKAGWEEDARVKVKVAAAHFPAVFKAVHKKATGEWHVEFF